MTWHHMSEGWVDAFPRWIQVDPFLITFNWGLSCLSTSKLAISLGGWPEVQDSGTHGHYPCIFKIRGLGWAVKLIVGIHSLAYFIKTNPSQAAVGAQVPVFQNSLGDKKVMRYWSFFIGFFGLFIGCHWSTFSSQRDRLHVLSVGSREIRSQPS